MAWHRKVRDTMGPHHRRRQMRGLCVVTCSEKRNVFGFDEKEKKAVVLNPDNCMVGCNNCQVACLWNAISFPSVAGVKDVIRKLIDEGQVKKRNWSSSWALAIRL